MTRWAIPVTLLLAAGRAEAAGYHYLKVEAVAATSDSGDGAVGLGAGTFSDLVHGWIAFGPPGDGGVVREGWLESRRLGPVLGVVAPAFEELVEPYRSDWLLPWTSLRLGGDASLHQVFEVALAQYGVLDLPGFAGVDPRRAYAGPAVGLGATGTWWRDWRDVPGDRAATGRVTGRGGLVAGVTVRDSWYLQGHGVARLDLFGDHQWGLAAVGSTGVFFERIGVPVGLEVTGELDHGTDNVHHRRATTWQARAALYWKLVAPYQTRLEEDVERRNRPAGR